MIAAILNANKKRGGHSSASSGHHDLDLLPPEHLRLFSHTVEVPGLVPKTWETRLMYVTQQNACFGKPGSNNQTDYIPLEEMIHVAMSKEHRVGTLRSLQKSFSKSFRSTGDGSVPTTPDNVDNRAKSVFPAGEEKQEDESEVRKRPSYVVLVKTARDGHNAGRTYQLRARTLEHGQDMVKQLNKAIDDALTKPGDGIMAKLKRKTKTFYEGDTVQMFVAVLIVTAFICSIASAEILPDLGPEELKEAEVALYYIEFVYTVLFTIELAVNFFANYFVAFFKSSWNIFDLLVVLICWLAFSSDDVPNVSLLRLLRVFRVVRLFRGLASLRLIIHALAMSMVPVMHACSIFLLTTAIYATIATGLFKETSPELFGKFSTSAFTMFQVATGDAWASEVARELWRKDGQMHIPTALFFVSFVLIVAIVLMNVVIACLLDRFITTMADEKEQMRSAAEEETVKDRVIRPGPLDPLLKRLVTFTSMEELDHQISLLVKKVDINNDQTLTCRELNAGFRNLDYFDPPLDSAIHLSREHYEALSDGLLDENQELSASMFIFMIRRELERYMEKQLVKGISTADESMLGALCGIKLLVSPLTNPKSRPTSTMELPTMGQRNAFNEHDKVPWKPVAASENHEGQPKGDDEHEKVGDVCHQAPVAMFGGLRRKEMHQDHPCTSSKLETRMTSMEENVAQVKSSLDSVEDKLDEMLWMLTQFTTSDQTKPNFMSNRNGALNKIAKVEQNRTSFSVRLSTSAGTIPPHGPCLSTRSAMDRTKPQVCEIHSQTSIGESSDYLRSSPTSVNDDIISVDVETHC